MHISVVGTGYVGLVTGACFASFGWRVTCIDRDAAKIETLNRGDVPFYEPGLAALVKQGTEKGTLSFSTRLEDSIPESDVVMIAVGTPSTPQGDADLSAVYAVSRQIAPLLKEKAIVVTKSTVPVGTSQALTQHIRTTNPKASFFVASNPEFLREGSAIEDFMFPDRVVLGADDPWVLDQLKRLYTPLVEQDVPVVETSCETSELIKYASNAFLAVKVSFINEIAQLCEQIDANVEEVARGMGLDQRIGQQFLKAGPGYGGSCFPKDTRALVQKGKQMGTPLRVVEAAIKANDHTQRRMVDKIQQALGGTLKGKTLGILGITFKANTDDLRDSPSLTILPLLQEQGAKLQVYDPEGMQEGQKLFNRVEWCEDSYAAAEDADAVVILTDWDVFASLDLKRLKAVLRHPTMIDLRNLFDAKQVAQAGLTYTSVGKQDVLGSKNLATTAAA